jgi:GDP-mannose 6-dehydrogenase
MEIAIVGLGYVGTVSAACLASAGHSVWGVDVNAEKVRMIEAGRSPIVEPGLDDRIAATRTSGGLRVTLDLREALARAEACFVAVATPSFPNGDIDATHIFRACEQIAHALAELGRSVPVIIRSSILPSILEQCDAKIAAIAPGLAKVCVNPEFLREGTAIQDFETPPFTLLGVEDQALEVTLRSLYQSIPAPVIVLSAKAATFVKYASNAFHALKATFANEIGALCREAGVDGQSVMATFCRDTKLNISERYLRPGFAFGGSCLPKDVRAILYAAKRYDVDLPLIHSLLPSNEAVIQRAFRQIIAGGHHRIGFIGLAFKSNTDDLRESPFVELAERLLGKGRDLKIYDPNVTIAHLTGANKQYIDHVIPHISRLLVDSLDDLAGSEFLIVGHQYKGVPEFLQKAGLPYLQL